MKSEVYSWRLTPGLKADLERIARVRKLRLSALLDMAVREWLARNVQEIAGDEEQKRLHAAAERWAGTFASGNRRGSRTVRETVRKRLARKYGR